MNIGEFVQDLADSWLNYLAGIVALSAVTMAILQTAKDRPVRCLEGVRRICVAS